MLDSDIQGADAQMYVKFYTCDRKPYEGVPFLRMMAPGDKTNVWDQPVRECDKERFPRHWLAYQMSRDTGEGPMVVGTPLSAWHTDAPDALSENQMLEMQALGFQTVEHIASASDGQIQRVGMGGAGLRERARQWLSVRNRSASETELADTKAQLRDLQAQMAAMMEMMATPTDKRGPGRPKKEQADVIDDNAGASPAGN